MTKPNTTSGLTTEEQEIADLTVELMIKWNKFESAITTNEMRQFVDAIHTIQDILMCRIARREYPGYWK